MSEVALWGPSEHETAALRDSLERELAARRLGMSRHDLGSPPPAAARVAVINTKTKVAARELDAMPALELLITTTSGYDHIDLGAAKQRGVIIARCPEARRDAVVDASVAAGMALLRRLPWMSREVAAGRWVRKEVKAHPIPNVRDLTVGVVGLGVIGRRAHDVWTALGADALGCDPAVSGAHSFEDVISRCELITFHCSLTESSLGMLDAEAVARLARGAVVVNTARGECVDLDALLSATHLGGVALDVFTTEPPVDLASRVGARDDVLLTPHSAGYHRGLGMAIVSEVTRLVDAWRAGEPLHGRVI